MLCCSSSKFVVKDDEGAVGAALFDIVNARIGCGAGFPDRFEHDRATVGSVQVSGLSAAACKLARYGGKSESSASHRNCVFRARKAQYPLPSPRRSMK
jgi:hypothetical protein